ncbi:MAG: LytTR family transcriptional regulator DNA-binding domain-containing protein [Lachnospiraceae bacterium]|nr:LytTR family transcriptional regulator DNA-binding domain-containing protein [Lachnospiraceae bacterium]
MKKINIRFEKDIALKTIEVLFRASERDREVEALMGKLAASGSENIPVTDGNGIVNVVRASDIVLLSVNGKSVNVITEEDRFTAKQSLGSLEECLDPSRFVRISRFEIANLAKVVRYDFTFSGTLRIELAGGIETWASRRCIPLIRKRLAGKE